MGVILFSMIFVSLCLSLIERLEASALLNMLFLVELCWLGSYNVQVPSLVTWYRFRFGGIGFLSVGVSFQSLALGLAILS